MTALLRRRRTGDHDGTDDLGGTGDLVAGPPAAPPVGGGGGGDDSGGDAHGGRRRRRRLLGALVVLVAVVAGLAAAALFTPVLPVRTVTVVGEVEVPRDDLLAAAGVAEGDPFARVDLRRARRGLRALPQVASARAERRWPGTVRLVVTPERPLVGFVAPGRVQKVSANGRVISVERSVEALPAILPRVAVPALDDLRPGDVVDRRLLEVLEVHAAATETLLPELFSGEMGRDGTLTFASPNGGTILFGLPEDVPAKLLAAGTVLGGRVVRDCLATLDLRDPARPTVSRTPGCSVPAPTTGAAGRTPGAAVGGGAPEPQGKLVCDKFGCKVVAPDGTVLKGGNGGTGAGGAGTGNGPTAPGATPNRTPNRTGSSTGNGTGAPTATTLAPVTGGRLVCDKFGCKVVGGTSPAGAAGG